jgi:hypothetical protein
VFIEFSTSESSKELVASLQNNLPPLFTPSKTYSLNAEEEESRLKQGLKVFTK